MKRALLLIASVCWIVFGIGFGALLFRSIADDAEVPFFWVFSPFNVLVSLAHVVGLAMASLVAFAVGAGLWIHAFVPRSAIHKGMIDE